MNNPGYIPPLTPEGKTCVYQCEFSKIQCEELEELKQEVCEEKEELKYERCSLDEDKDKYCSNESWKCSANHTRCETMYRACYQACGGTVESETTCVRNCDEL